MYKKVIIYTLNDLKFLLYNHIYSYINNIIPVLELDRYIVGEFIWNYNLPTDISYPTLTKLLDNIFIPTDIKNYFFHLFYKRCDELYEDIKVKVGINNYYTILTSGVKIYIMVFSDKGEKN